MSKKERANTRRPGGHWILLLGGLLLLGALGPAIVQAQAPATVTVIASDRNAAEAGQDMGVFTIKRVGLPSNPLTVSFSLTGTATLNVDYSTQPPCAAFPCTVTIPASFPTTTLEVRPIDDSSDEPTELVDLTILPNPAYMVGAANAATVRIADDDLPSVTVTASDDQASETAGNPGQFRFTRTAGDTRFSLIVRYSVEGNATNGADHAPLSGIVRIPAGATSENVAVTPNDDVEAEAPENVSVRLTPDTTYVVGAPAVANVTISDNEMATVTIHSADPVAEEPGLTEATFTVSRPTGDTANPLRVDYAASGTATRGADYGTSPACCNVTIPVGERTADILVTPIHDTFDEADETIVLRINVSVNYTVGEPSEATALLLDDDLPSVNVTAPDKIAHENGSAAGKFRFNRTTNNTASNLTVRYSISGNATNGADYEPLSGIVIIQAGFSSENVTVSATNDAIDESPENVTVTLDSDPGYTIANPSVANVTIADDDLPSVNIATNDPVADEPTSEPAKFQVSRTQTDSSYGLTVAFDLTGTADRPTDYTVSPACCNVIIPAGSQTAEIIVTPTDDPFNEGRETVVVRLNASANYTVGTPSEATAIIFEDDLPSVNVTAPDKIAHENGSAAGKFRFNRTTNNTASNLTVRYSISGNATNGADYEPLSGIVIIQAGFSSENVTVVARADELDEPMETATVTLEADPGYTLGGPSVANVDVLDDDLPSVNIVASDSEASEAGANPARFVVTRITENTADELRVAFEFLGTSHFDADEDKTDFLVLPPCCNVTVEAGDRSAEIILTPVDDDADELRESIEIQIVANANYTVGAPPNATATLEDADGPNVTIEAVDAAAEEGSAETGTFLVTRTADDTSLPLVVSYALGGDATNGVDYAFLSGNVTIPPQETTAEIVVVPLEDTIPEGDEKVTASLRPSANYTVASPSTANFTINDNEPGPPPPPPPSTLTVAVPAPNASEWGPIEGRFEVRRSADETAESVTASYALSGTAVRGTDYTVDPPCCNVTILAGAESASITVTPAQGAETEPVETLRLTLEPGASYKLGSPREGNMTISDYTTPLVTLNVTDPSASESGDPGNFRFQRTGNVSQQLTIPVQITGTASNGQDYRSLSSAVILLAGETFIDLRLNPTDDGVDEPDETVAIEILTSPEYRLGSAAEVRGTVSILDDDQAPSVFLSAPDPEASEATLDPGTVRLTRAGGVSAESLTVHLVLSGTATSASDFQPLQLSITMPPGQASRDIPVTPIDDPSNEATETVTLTFASSPAYVVGTPIGVSVRILDNDPSGITNFFVTGVTAMRMESGSVDVTWDYELPSLPSQPTIAGWLVWRSTSPFVLLESIEDGAARRLVDTTAPADATPIYAVSFFLESGEGRVSNVADVPGFVQETELPQSEEVPPLERPSEGADEGVPLWVLVLTTIIFILALLAIGWYVVERRPSRAVQPKQGPAAPPAEAGSATPASASKPASPAASPKSGPGPL